MEPTVLNAAATMAGPSGLRVLVVDDNATNRRVAELLLRRRGAMVVTAIGGHEALDRLAREPFDLVFLDGMMPGISGPATAREIRRRERAHSLIPIPIVALTASVLPEDRRDLLDSGMDDHLAKPLRSEELGAMLTRWVDAERGARRGTTIPPLRAEPAHTTDGHDAVERPSVLDPLILDRLRDVGDRTMIERMVWLFLADAGERIAQVELALARHDELSLVAALRALAAICGSVGAVAMRERVDLMLGSLAAADDDKGGATPIGLPGGGADLRHGLEATRSALVDRLAEG